MPTRFSEEDARRIFARAAARQRADEPPAEGLTLAELQEIGRAAGLDPDAVAAAVAELQAGDVATGPTFAGVPGTQRSVRVLPVAVSDAAWERMVDALRKEFGAQGTAGQIGRVREWSASPGPSSAYGDDPGVVVTLEPVPEGTRVTVERRRARLLAQVRQLAWVAVVAPLLFAGIPLATGEPVAWLLPALLALIFGVIVGGYAVMLPRSAQQHALRAEAVLDRFELIARVADDGPPATNTDLADARRLGLDALGDAPADEDASSGARHRSRS